MSIRAFALDLDGTLVDSIPDLSAAANQVRRHFHLPPLAEDRIRSHVGDGVATLVHRALTDLRDGSVPLEQHAEAMNVFLAWYGDHIDVHTRIYPGVLDALQQMRDNGYAIALVTNKSIALAEKLTTRLELAPWFALQVGGDSLPEKKPSAQPLHHVAHALGIQTQEIAMVGDSINDVLCARNAGSLAISVSYGYEDVSSYAADYIAATLADAVEFVKNRH